MICPNADKMLELLDTLKSGYTTPIETDDGKNTNARLIMYRCKNKVADLDPTHFRNMLANLLLSVEDTDGTSRSAFVEIQIHQKDIIK